jgi:hypothetical protein
MECPCCGTYSPPDPETGYDVDEPCPICKLDDEECVDEWEHAQLHIWQDDV